MANNYVFRGGGRAYYNGTDEIRLRLGGFNYEEVELDMSPLSKPLAAFLRQVIGLLGSEGGYDTSLLNEQLLEPYEKEIAQSIINELHATNYIVSLEERTVGQELTMALLG